MSARNQRYMMRAVTEEQWERWDAWLSARPDGHLLQSWIWGDLKSKSGWHPLRLALWDEERDEIVAAAQVLRKTAPRLPLRLGHLAYIPKGPVLDWSQPDLCVAFFAQLDNHLRRQGALALRMDLMQEEGTPEAELVLKRMQALDAHTERTIQPLRTIIVDLEHSEEEILARMKEKWRYNVGLARRRGVTVRVAETEEDVRAWYDLLRVTCERDGFGVHTLDYYLDAQRLLGQQNYARIFLAEFEGQLLGGIFVTLFAREGIYLYGASSNEQRKHMPNHLLQWEAMCWAKRNGATRYDLWGIPATDDDDEAMAGVYRFKSGWGGRVTRFLGCYERVYNPLGMSLARRFI